MRALLAAALATVVALAAPAAADDAWGEPEWPVDVGLQLGADVSAGAVAAVTFRPFVPWARLHGGMTWNYYAFGLQGGATFMPWRGGMTPTATLQLGTTFDTDLRSAFSGLSIPEALRPSLASAGYSYAEALVGLEFGNPRGSAFYVRGGVARAWSTLHGVENYPAGSGHVNTTELHVSGWAPMVSLGAVVRLW